MITFVLNYNILSKLDLSKNERGVKYIMMRL